MQGVSRANGWGKRAVAGTMALCLWLAGCSGGSSGSDDTDQPANTAPGVLSISAYYYTEPAAASDAAWLQRFVQAFELARSAGADGQFQSYRWSELEPTLGVYDAARMQEFRSAMQHAESEGLTQLLGIQLINTVTREVPAELNQADWDSASMQNAMRALLDQLIPHLRNRVHYISIGNEVDVYFQNADAAELDAYRDFFASAAQYLRQQLPGVQVGITLTAGSLLGADPRWPQLVADSDVMIATYYPLQADFSVQPPQRPAQDFPDLLARAGGKNLVLQEVGYPSSTINGSSEAMQAEFVHQAFAAWRDSNGRIPFLNLFLLHDFSTELVNVLTGYYGSSDPRFRAYLDSLGLRHRNNTDKLAWPAVLQEAQASGLR